MPYNPKTKKPHQSLSEREDFKKEALTAWKEYQATGKHVKGEGVIAWLEIWGDNTSKQKRVTS